jgi:hypothetical protein
MGDMFSPPDPALGAIMQHADAWRPQQHLRSPTVDLTLGPRWAFSVAVGVGGTPRADRLLLRLILGHRIGCEGGAEP